MKKLFKIFLGFLSLLVLLTIYTIWDNNRITVSEQEIVIDGLPEQFEGFRILQVSDLHEKTFGENQTRLIEAINLIDYDATVFTGDMLDSTQSTNYKPFYSLLEGLDNKEHAWFVPGNTDPYPYQFTPEIEKSAFIKGTEERGVKLLESIGTVTREEATLSFVNFELAIKESTASMGANEGTVAPPYDSNKKYLQYRRELWEEISITPEDTVIALNHYPVPDPRVDFIENSGRTVWRDFELLIAGHYHGGQIRLPFIGVIFIPEAWYGSGFFPPQNRVKGLWEYNETKQYVSTGLGSSDAVSFLEFRLFNPPEINILTLKGE